MFGKTLFIIFLFIGILGSAWLYQLTHLSKVDFKQIEEDERSAATPSNGVELDLDGKLGQLQMENRRKTVSLFSQKNLSFTAKKLFWDHENNVLTLNGGISIEEPSLGSFFSDNTVSFSKKGKQISSFKSFGTTTLTYLNHHSLVSHGVITFEKESLSSTIQSPLINGMVPKGLQLCYKGDELGLYADKARVDYREENGKLFPLVVSLEGEVQLFSLSQKNKSRFGLADHLTYHPKTGSFILTADPNKKVCFVDKKENLYLSAREVHLTRDPITNKQVVKGVGNVRLALTVDEKLKIKKYFGFFYEL